MNPYSIRLIAFGLVGLIQLAAPLAMIARREQTLRLGEVYRFRAAPVDPYDPFRGRYVTIVVASNSATRRPDQNIRPGQQVAVSLVTAEDGYTSCGEILDAPPETGAWLWARARDVRSDTVRLEMPFDRYYMNEQDAPEAERLYFQHLWRGAENRDPVWIRVRIHQGQAVLEGLMIGEQTIEDVIMQQSQDITP